MDENQNVGTVTIEEPTNNADIMAQMMEEYDSQQAAAAEQAPEQDTAPEADEAQDTPEPEEDDGDLEVIEEPISDTESGTESGTQTTQSSKTNQAFKQMRQEVENYKAMAQANDAYANVIKEIAKANGITPDELVKNYNDKKNQEAADKAGISVETYNKINELEAEVQALRNKPIEEKFNSEIDNLIKKYNLNDEAISQFFREASENGFDLTKVKDIGKVYDFLNVDKVINKKEQERLEQKEKVKKQAPLPPTSTTEVEIDEDAEVKAMLEKHGAWNG